MSEKFHVYDPGLGGNCIIAVFDALEEAVNAANETIKENWRPDSGEEWSDEVSCVSVYRAPEGCGDPGEDGELVAQAQEVDVVHRPDDADEDGYSESQPEYYWGSSAPDYYCDYRVVPLPAPEPSP